MKPLPSPGVSVNGCEPRSLDPVACGNGERFGVGDGDVQVGWKGRSADGKHGYVTTVCRRSARKDDDMPTPSSGDVELVREMVKGFGGSLGIPDVCCLWSVLGHAVWLSNQVGFVFWSDEWLPRRRQGFDTGDAQIGRRYAGLNRDSLWFVTVVLISASGKELGLVLNPLQTATDGQVLNMVSRSGKMLKDYGQVKVVGPKMMETLLWSLVSSPFGMLWFTHSVLVACGRVVGANAEFALCNMLGSMLVSARIGDMG